jgi:hypothetical protein
MQDPMLKLATFLDPALGPLLGLSQDLALLAAILLTAVALVLVRRWTTDQGRLRRCAADVRTLKDLLRQAAASGDAAAADRHRVNLMRVRGKMLRSEGTPLLISLVPLAILGTWCFCRLGYVPLRAGDPVALRASLPASADGEIIHLVPQDGLDVDGGWIRRLKVEGSVVGTAAVAEWVVRGEARPTPYVLEFRMRERTLARELVLDGRHYVAPVQFLDGQDGGSVAVQMTMYHPLGVVPGVPALGLPPWVIAYLILVIPSVWLLKRAMKVA